MTTWRRLRNMLGGSAGNFVEWFDWFAYASFAIYFSRAFFPEGSQTVPAAQHGVRVRGRISGAPGRRAAHGRLCGPGRAARGAHAVRRDDVRRLADDRADPDRARLSSRLFCSSSRACCRACRLAASTARPRPMSARWRASGNRGFWSGCLYVTLIGGQLAAVMLQVLLQSRAHARSSSTPGAGAFRLRSVRRSRWSCSGSAAASMRPSRS